jgi:hypothetical protein
MFLLFPTLIVIVCSLIAKACAYVQDEKKRLNGNLQKNKNVVDCRSGTLMCPQSAPLPRSFKVYFTI